MCTPSCFRGPLRVYVPNGISIGSAALHSSRQRVPILYDGPSLSPVKIAHLLWGIWTSSNTWFPLESTTQTASRLLQPFCRAHDRDRQIDIPRYFVCNSRPHLLAQVVLRCDLKSGMAKRPSKVKGKVWGKASHPIKAVRST